MTDSMNTYSEREICELVNVRYQYSDREATDQEESEEYEEGL